MAKKERVFVLRTNGPVYYAEDASFFTLHVQAAKCYQIRRDAMLAVECLKREGFAFEICMMEVAGHI